jgi:hypothetical protein
MALAEEWISARWASVRNGAVAGACDDDVAVLVGGDLCFDVAGLVEVALDEAFTATERCDGFAGGGVEQFGDLFAGAGDLHAAAAAAEGGFDGDGEAVFVGEGKDFLGVLHRFCGAGNGGCFGAGGDVAGGDFVAEVADGLGGGSDPDQACVDDGLGEVGVFGEEAVAGVDGVGTGLGCGAQEFVDHQIRFRRGLAAEREGFVGEADVGGVGVGFGVDGDRGVARVCCCSDHPDCDLPAIGDEHLGNLLHCNTVDTHRELIPYRL